MTRKHELLYVAEWIEAIHEPPIGRDFNPHRDVDYVTRGGFKTAAEAGRYAASKDIHGEGYVHEYETRRVDGLPLRSLVNTWPAYEVEHDR